MVPIHQIGYVLILVGAYTVLTAVRLMIVAKIGHNAATKTLTM